MLLVRIDHVMHARRTTFFDKAGTICVTTDIQMSLVKQAGAIENF